MPAIPNPSHQSINSGNSTATAVIPENKQTLEPKDSDAAESKLLINNLASNSLPQSISYMSTISTKSLVNSSPTIISQPIIPNPNILDRLIKIIQQNSQNYSIPTSELPTNYPNNLINLYNLQQKTSCPHYGTQQDSFLNNNNIYGLPNLDQIQINALELAQPKFPIQQVLFPTQQLPTLYRAHARELVFTFLSQQYFLSTQQTPSPYRAHA